MSRVTPPSNCSRTRAWPSPPHHEQFAAQRLGAIQQDVGKAQRCGQALDVGLDAVPQQPAAHLHRVQRIRRIRVTVPKERYQRDVSCLAQQWHRTAQRYRRLPAPVPGHQDPVQAFLDAARARNDENGPARVQHDFLGQPTLRAAHGRGLVRLPHHDQVAGPGEMDDSLYRLAVHQPRIAGQRGGPQPTTKHVRNGFGPPTQVQGGLDEGTAGRLFRART